MELPRDFDIPTNNPDMIDESISSTYRGSEKPVEIKINNILGDRNKPYKCSHEWKTVKLVFSDVTFCEKCDERKFND